MILGFYAPVSIKLLTPPKEFYEAAKNDNVKGLKKYVNGYYNVDALQGFGNNSVTGLALAIQNGSKNAVNKLVKRGCNVNTSCGPYGWSPLHYAVYSNKIGYVKFLLEHKAEVDQIDLFEKTPLILASEIGNWSMCELLLQKGACLHSKTTFEPLPMSLQVLINELGMTAEHIEDIKMPYQGCSAFLKACWNDNLDIVDLFLARGVDVHQVTSSGYNGLHIAASEGFLGLLDLMLINKCDMNRQTLNGETPLHIATRNIFKSVHDLNKSSEEILKQVTNHATIVKCLLQHGADQNIENKNGHTILYQMLSQSFPKVPYQETFNVIREKLLCFINEREDRISPRNIPPSEAICPDLRNKQVLDLIVQKANSPRKLQLLTRSIIREALGSSRLKLIKRTKLAATLQNYVTS